MRVQPFGFEIRGTGGNRGTEEQGGGEQGNRGGTGAERNLARRKVPRLSEVSTSVQHLCS